MLHSDPRNRSLAWKHGVDETVLDKPTRVKELANWISYQVLPTRSARSRG